MLRLEKVNGKNVWDILRLSVDEGQSSFVASNDVSIIEAYTTITNNGYAFPFGIYDGDTPVGFVMIGYDKDDYWDDAPAIANDNYNLWRLMIDKGYQKKGYGRKAIELALEFLKLLFHDVFHFHMHRPPLNIFVFYITFFLNVKICSVDCY